MNRIGLYNEEELENGERIVNNFQSSFGSLSQVGVVVRNLLRGPNTVSRCKGNPLTEKGKRIQLVKMLLLTLIPILSLTLLAAVDLSNIVKSSSIDAEVRNAIKFSRDIGVLLSRLQKERDMSALFASPIRPQDNSGYLTETYPLTDTALENLKNWPIKTSVLTALPFFHEKQDLKQHLARHRQSLHSTNTTIYEEIYFYTELLQIFIDWLYESVGNSKGHGMWKTLVAYQLLVVSNVDTGIERTLGTVFFTRGSFDIHSDYVWYLNKYNVGTWYFQASMGYSERIAHLYSVEMKKLDQNITQTIDGMRNIILTNSNKTGNTSQISVTSWFDIMTMYINIMEKVQKDMAQNILDQLNHEIDKDSESIAISVALVIAVIILCPLTLRAILTTTRDIQNYALTLAVQAKRVDKEKKRSNWLLYSMLPKLIAGQLMCNNEVKAEYYDLVTVLFSDIVGFNKLCSISTPLQVVEMLNGLYMMIDSRIERYDVYKVDTVNEKYMLASGLPTPNGYTHASEIATAAIDILYHINSLAVPVNPKKKFTIRIGIHTGPVVAGVVGLKMPRYCLFGDTVKIASLMQTNGMPNHIHISRECYLVLSDFGKFTMLSRGSVRIKGRKKNMETYWLMGRSDFSRLISTDYIQSISTTGLKVHEHRYEHMYDQVCTGRIQLHGTWSASAPCE
ncbi:uncharacterized protein LOC117124706 [Anneissia japonica]|uniref:uncharacterized protein LOC117124706 n=1 Tax=Anneissia japonica TaxID=1529436 RepID=UPI0014256FCB|nr:uncharacterized protein LOC117124706 [Anneissia japonica]